MYWSPVWTKSFTDTQTQHNVMHSLTMNTYVVHCRFIKLIFSDQMLNSMLNTLTIRDYSQIKGKKTHELFDKIDYSFMTCHIAFLSGKYDKFCQKFFWSFDKYYQCYQLACLVWLWMIKACMLGAVNTCTMATSLAFPVELGKTPRIYHIGIHDNHPSL